MINSQSTNTQYSPQSNKQTQPKLFSVMKQQNSSKNAVKINFTRKSRLFDHDSPQKYISDIANNAIDPWNSQTNDNDGHLDTFTKTYNYINEKDIKGITRLKQSSNKNRRNSNRSWDIANKAALTARSWNAERDRLVHIRKQLKMATPVFPTQQNQIMGVDGSGHGQGGTFLGELKRRNQENNNNQNKNGHSSDIFSKHRKLLSRIYSHSSCDPKIIIRGFSHEHQNSQFAITQYVESSSSQKLKKIIESAARKKDYKILYNFQNFGSHRKQQSDDLQFRHIPYSKSQQKHQNKTYFKTNMKSTPFNFNKTTRRQFLKIN